MSKLYYGNGYCNIEGSGIRGVEIRYKGAISIEDKTSASFVLMASANKVLIFPIGEGFLNELFTYKGQFKITSVIVADDNGDRIDATVHRVMDYSELLTSKSEDMTTKSEDLKVTYTNNTTIAKTSLSQPHWENLHTAEPLGVGDLFLQDGSKYDGYFHIHLDDGKAMTGKIHTGESQDLYYKRLNDRGEVIDNLISAKPLEDEQPSVKLRKRRYR